jgi:LysM repeat protein
MPGDTLGGLAKAAGTNVEEVARWNALDPLGKIPEGLFLQLFVDATTIDETMQVLREGDVRIVRVGSDEFFNLSEANRGRRRKMIVAKAGDTLEAIGKRFGLSGAAMERINRRARNDALEEGTPVVVYLAGRSAGSDANAAKGPDAPGDGGPDGDRSTPPSSESN